MDEHHWAPHRPPRPFVIPVKVDPRGILGPTPGAARGQRWERVWPGWYVPAGTDRSLPEQRVAEVGVCMHRDGVLTGWASLLLRGAAFLDGRTADGRRRLPVAVAVPPGCNPRPHRGMAYHQAPLRRRDSVHGLLCLPAPWATFDAMRLAPSTEDAVVALDMAAAAGLVTILDIEEVLATRSSWRGVPGVPRVRSALPLATEGSASPPEVRVRLVWVVDAGLPPPLVNVAVHDRTGRLLGYPDLLDPVAGLAIEYDGEDHRSAQRHSDDVDREAGFREVGLEMARVTSGDLRDRRRLVHRLLAARRRSRFEPEVERRWVVGRPRRPSYRPGRPHTVQMGSGTGSRGPNCTE
ncbi:hypothetical protein [Nocardioides caldifontis]|uniref:hypothetical protein n=1 Tax=Nocardioides caldifontis TaxID=2588938 RepID=UPI0011DF6717|nr:hypothetical protein [Nocardioides caldifontis]